MKMISDLLTRAMWESEGPSGTALALRLGHRTELNRNRGKYQIWLAAAEVLAPSHMTTQTRSSRYRLGFTDQSPTFSHADRFFIPVLLESRHSASIKCVFSNTALLFQVETVVGSNS